MLKIKYMRARSREGFFSLLLDGGPWSSAGLKDSWSGLIFTGSYPVSHG